MLADLTISLVLETNPSLEVLSARISNGAKVVYLQLCTLPKTANNKIEISLEPTAKYFNISVAVLKKNLKALEQANFITTNKQQKPSASPTKGEENGIRN